MLCQIKDKIAIVTGAGRGIGKEIATQFLNSGAKVALIGRSENVKEIAAKLGVDCKAYICDVRNLAEVESAVKQIVSDFGGIDILVNNAGLKSTDRLTIQTKEEDWDLVIDTNLKGYFNMIKACGKYLMKSPAGRIINISSVLGVQGMGGQVAYSASKSGIFGLTKAVSQELASRNVTCNAIIPGFIDTEMNQDFSEERKLEIQNAIPLKRFGQTTEVANLVSFISSD